MKKLFACLVFSLVMFCSGCKTKFDLEYSPYHADHFYEYHDLSYKDLKAISDTVTREGWYHVWIVNDSPNRQADFEYETIEEFKESFK